MFGHCFASFTIVIIAIICSSYAFVLQCQNCQCLPDYCPRTVPQSLCPCGGLQVPCTIGQTTTGIQTMLSGATNIIQQPVAPQYVLVQQPVPSIQGQLTGQFVMQGQTQQQLIQTLGGQMLVPQQPQIVQPQIIPQQPQIVQQQPQVPPIYIIRTIEQQGQVVQQIQQVPQSPQYVSAIQQLPLQQTQMVVVPALQQMIPQQQQQQQLVIQQIPQLPTYAITLQIPVTMAESCTPRANVCPVGLPSVHAVTECDNATDSTATRCITIEEAKRLYTCLPSFSFNTLWG